jgi:hypothetical protein
MGGSSEPRDDTELINFSEPPRGEARSIKTLTSNAAISGRSSTASSFSPNIPTPNPERLAVPYVRVCRILQVFMAA